MSLESAIADLTAALRENTAARLGTPAPTAPSGESGEPAGAEAPPQRRRRSSTAVAPAQTAAPTPPVAPPPAAAPTAPAPTLKEWTETFLRVGEKPGCRQPILDILKHFGVERASLVPPEKFAEAIGMAYAIEKNTPAPAPQPSAASLV